jgi:cobalt-zinc-cadmium efflux system membrane fusion protein
MDSMNNSEFRIQNSEAGFSNQPSVIGLKGRLLACLLIGLAFLSGCTSQAPAPASAPPAQKADQGIVELAPEALQGGRVQWEAAKISSMPELIRVTGRIGVNENLTSRVGSIVDGRVADVFANVGDQVRKGDQLARLVSHQVHDARAEYAKARAELQQRQSELEFARNAAKRASRLYELKAASLEQVQRAQADVQSAESAVTVARVEVNRVAEQLRHLGLSTAGAEDEYTKAIAAEKPAAAGEYEEDELVPVLAPLGGTVLKRLVSPGTVVTPSSDLMVISDLTVLWVNAEVPEKYLPALKVGRSVGITVQAYGDQVFPGRITYIGDTLNPATRTVEVRCETQNREGKLKPEMYATIGFGVGEVTNALLIPTVAIQDIEGQSTVFVRESETRFRARKIRVGRQAGSQSEVLEGLSPGEVVVSTGSFLVKSELLNRNTAAE